MTALHRTLLAVVIASMTATTITTASSSAEAVSPSSIVFANQNYGYNGLQFPSSSVPRTAGFFGSPRGDDRLDAKCIIHPKRLGRRV